MTAYKDTPCPTCGRERVVRVGRPRCSRCDGRIRSGGLKSRTPSPDFSRGPAPVEVPDKTYEDVWREFQDLVGITKKRNAHVPVRNEKDRVRYGVISDLHIPFHNEASLLESIDWMKQKKVDVLIVGGDMLDCYSLSRFSQYQPIPIKRELQEARKILDHLSRTFSEIRLVEGNHESRERKYLAARISADMLEYILTKSMLQRLSEDMPNVHFMTRMAHGTALHWLTEVGDAVVGHHERQTRIPLRAVEWFKDWMDNWHEEIEFQRPRLVISGHTHMAGYTFAGRTMIVETGCQCLMQGYSLEPKLYSKPQRLAATIFDQVNGISDFNSVDQFFPENRRPSYETSHFRS